MRILFYCILFIISFRLYFNQDIVAQLVVDPLVTPDEMVDNLAGVNINYYNINYEGSDSANAIFCSNGYNDIELKEGICLSSGRIKYAGGPNSFNENLSYVNGTFGDFLLSGLLQQSITWDAAILEFDILTTKSLLSLSFFFASEEYPEWADVNKDIIGVFLTGANPIGSYFSSTNIATIPDTSLPICVININNVIPSFPEYYIDNSSGQYFAYDGLTTVFSPFIYVYPDSVYHIRIGIADENDSYYDSGFFLEKGSLLSIDSTDFTRYRFKVVNNQNLEQDIIGTIENDSIKLCVPNATDISQLVSSFTIPPGTNAYVGNVLQKSDTTISDFTEPVIYTLVAGNGNSKDWTVVVDYLPNNENEILEYEFLVENNPNLSEDLIGEFIGQVILFYAPVGTNLIELIATYTLSDNATAYVNGVYQQSSITPNNFYNTVHYDIIAENGDTNFYHVNVLIASGENDYNKKSNILIYPNPAKDYVFVQNANGSDFKLYNHTGKLVQTFIISSQNKQIPVNHLPSGVYYLHIDYLNKVFLRKIIIK